VNLFIFLDIIYLFIYSFIHLFNYLFINLFIFGVVGKGMVVGRARMNNHFEIANISLQEAIRLSVCLQALSEGEGFLKRNLAR